MSMRITLVVLHFFIPIFLFAQTRTITGTVSDDKGVAIAGVSVLVKGTNNGAQTDASGNFKLTVNSASGKVVLSFSYLGYKKLEASTDGSRDVTIQLEKEENSLEDVVVIGYGKAKKKDLTGSVGVLSGKELLKT